MTALLLLAACATHAVTKSASPYKYPDNAALPRSAFVDLGTAIRSLHINGAADVVVATAPSGDVLLRWAQVVTPEIALRTVAPGRMVYEITTIHARPFTVGPTRYRSGRQTTIVDAQTGAWLITIARGTQASRTMRTP